MLISILWIILLIFQYLQYTYAQRLTSESPNFYDIPFFKSSDFVQIISTAYVNSSLIGTAPRIYGLKNEYQEIEFEICAPTTTECEKQKGRLALCYFHPNAEDDMENDCHRNFCSIDFKFNGTDSSNRNITISTKYEHKEMNIRLGSSLCVSLFLNSNESLFKASNIETIPACRIGSVNVKNKHDNSIQLQTAIYLRDQPNKCSPKLKITNLNDEYVQLPPTTTTPRTTTITESTTTTTTSTTTSPATTTPMNVEYFFSHYWWGPVLSAIILITITSLFCIFSCIYRKRSAERANRLYRNVLIRRHKRKAAMERMKREEITVE